MKALAFLILLLSSYAVLAQKGPLNKFYCENQLYKRLKVKSVTDSFVSSPRSTLTTEYDSLGREIGEYGPGGALIHSFDYSVSHDTIYRNEHVYLNYEYVSAVETFIYSKTKKILKYTKYHSGYSHENKAHAEVQLFFYDELDSLTTQIAYNSYDYQHQEQMNIAVDEKEMRISDVYYYSYFNKGKFKYVVATEAMGPMEYRTTDTMVYSGGKLVKNSSFAESRFAGEIKQYNSYWASDYSFSKDTLTTLSYSSHCLFTYKGACMEPSTSSIDKEQIIFAKNGLPLRKYVITDKGERDLLIEYIYSYYQ